jgi:hypothetical protein
MQQDNPNVAMADGGYFAAPIPQAAPVYGYGPLTGSGGPAADSPGRSATDGVPPLVVAAVAALVMAAVAALWLGLTMIVTVHAAESVARDVTGGAARSLGGSGFTTRGLLLILNGVANCWLGVQLVRGWSPARVIVTGLCGWWVCYWLYQAARATHAFGQLAGSPFGSFGFGQLAFMATVGILLLAGWAAATAALLWTTGSSRHFS